MGITIAVVNQKGGVGKTTTAVNLTATLAEAGQKVLLCDFDPQANATSGLGVDKRKVKKSVYDVVIDDISPKEVVVHTKFGDVLPSGADLAGAAVELLSLPEGNYRLKNALAEVKNDYDVILIDCPPSLELLTINALAAADEILIPVQCEYFALEGLADLMTTLRLMKKRINPTLEIFAVALTMFDGRTNFSTQVAQEVRRHFPGKVFATAIPRNVRLAEAPSHGLPITVYDKHSRGAAAYKAMTQEFIQKLAKR
ncbi:MAG: ParA family protein [Oscillospiraceae bacterium]|nr:ParA family protein [Oscillospiraceae bacterium]